MNTAHSTEEEKLEYFDSEDDLQEKCELLANMIKSSKYFITFTGAGISTSTGIPDFRSGTNTVLPTGPGAWELLATKAKIPNNFKVKVQSAIPSKAHMSLVKLQQEGLLKFLVSQNCDGLHRKSGIPANAIAEVHGNSNLEICRNESCKSKFMRDFKTRVPQHSHEHKTGRYCENCGSELHDSIINFGEYLHEFECKAGYKASRRADLVLVMGSSLKVTSTYDMVAETLTKKRKGKIVIVNLQKTPLDENALKINGMIDDVMSRVMKNLGLEIPEFILTRRVMVLKTDFDLKDPKNDGKPALVVRGCDEQGKPYTLFTKITVSLSEGEEKIVEEKDPLKIFPIKSDLKEGKVSINLEFYGHYNEPGFKFETNLENMIMNVPVYYKMDYDPSGGEWIGFEEFKI